MVTVVKKDEAAAAPDVGADLSDLMNEAQGLETEHGGAGQPGAPGQVPAMGGNLEAELLSALQMARMAAEKLAFSWWPEFREVWSDQTLQSIATAGAEIMRRHGWGMGELLSKWGPYFALGGAILPPSMVTYQVIKQRQEDERRAARARGTPMAQPAARAEAANDGR